MYAVARDGSLIGVRRTRAAPRACAQLGEVISVASVPLSAWIVALLRKPQSSTTHLALWSALDASSYAILNEYSDCATETVDAQLTQDEDVYICTSARQADGRAANVIHYCVRVSGTDLSTLRHVEFDEASMARLQMQRGALGATNHMDHGNVLAVSRLFESGKFWTRAWYGSECADFPVKAEAVFGNACAAYAWGSGKVYKCRKHDAAWTREEVGTCESPRIVGAVHVCET